MGALGQHIDVRRLQTSAAQQSRIRLPQVSVRTPARAWREKTGVAGKNSRKTLHNVVTHLETTRTD